MFDPLEGHMWAWRTSPTRRRPRRRWCADQVPEHAREIRVESGVKPRHLTIGESRSPWRAGLGPTGSGSGRPPAPHEDHQAAREATWDL